MLLCFYINLTNGINDSYEFPITNVIFAKMSLRGIDHQNYLILHSLIFFFQKKNLYPCP